MANNWFDNSSEKDSNNVSNMESKNNSKSSSKSGNNVSIPRPPNVVTILWQRNPLRPRSPRTIVSSSVIGVAAPCQNFLQSGQRFRNAEECLLTNGFVLIFEKRFGVFGLSQYLKTF